MQTPSLFLCLFTIIFLLQLARANQANTNYPFEFPFTQEPNFSSNMTSKLAPVIALSHGGG